MNGRTIGGLALLDAKVDPENVTEHCAHGAGTASGSMGCNRKPSNTSSFIEMSFPYKMTEVTCLTKGEDNWLFNKLH